MLLIPLALVTTCVGQISYCKIAVIIALIGMSVSLGKTHTLQGEATTTVMASTALERLIGLGPNIVILCLSMQKKALLNSMGLATTM